MNYVFCVGEHDNRGRLVNSEWLAILDALSRLSSSIRVCTPMVLDQVQAMFGDTATIEKEDFGLIDPSLAYYSYSLKERTAQFWSRLAEANMDPDGGLTHVDFLCRDVVIATIEMDDESNFIVLLDLELEELGREFGLASAVDRTSIDWAGDISRLAEGKEWALIERKENV